MIRVAFRKSTCERIYRLIDSCCAPHRQLDADYSSLDEAIGEAVACIEQRIDQDPHCSLIGAEVRTGNGEWRTCRLPSELLCPLPCAQLAE
jgi:hypothetical protein